LSVSYESRLGETFPLQGELDAKLAQLAERQADLFFPSPVRSYCVVTYSPSRFSTIVKLICDGAKSGTARRPTVPDDHTASLTIAGWSSDHSFIAQRGHINYAIDHPGTEKPWLHHGGVIKIKRHPA
jgi:hypothetical protein